EYAQAHRLALGMLVFSFLALMMIVRLKSRQERVLP
ncbi:MAG: molybdate ABC transporter permease subunit, partial [Betaproteobacteria bacterium]|nr:molybdate ABC transporter permease subunit [Betaproteobacteria bacterium]